MAKIRTLVWSERTEPADVYPGGIDGAVAEHLEQNDELEVRRAGIDEPEHGLGEKALAETDTIVVWSHGKEISAEATAGVIRRFREEGMGIVALHSTVIWKPFMEIMGRGSLASRWDLTAEPEHVHVVTPSHPIAKGLFDFTVPQTEMWNEPWDVPDPDVVVLESRFDGGEYFRSGSCFYFGEGRLFFLRPGHESYPIYYQPEIRKIIENAVFWTAKQT